jgi:hypothetical protein
MTGPSNCGSIVCAVHGEGLAQAFKNRQEFLHTCNGDKLSRSASSTTAFHRVTEKIRKLFRAFVLQRGGATPMTRATRGNRARHAEQSLEKGFHRVEWNGKVERDCRDERSSQSRLRSKETTRVVDTREQERAAAAT